jgi:predicted nucleotidyltransferase
MDKNEVLSLAKKYAADVRESLNVQSVILYGSQAKGNPTENSDIDIAVIVDDVSGDYLDSVALLWKLSRKVNADIEPVLLTAADSDSGFLHTVRESGIAV